MNREDKVFFVLNLLIWILVYGMAFYFSVHEPKTKTEAASTLSHFSVDTEDNSLKELSSAEDPEEDQDVTDYDSTSSDEAASSVVNALSGTYISKSGDIFYFGPNGYYAGFFDSENTNIDGGTYTAEENDGIINVNIISPDGKRMVSYSLRMNGPINYILTYEATGFEIELEKKDE